MDIFAMIWFDLKSYFQNKISLILLIVIPLAFIGLVSYAVKPVFETNTYMERFKIAIVDQDNSVETRSLIQQFEDSPAIKNCSDVLKVNYDEAMKLLKEDKIAAAVVIPVNFAGTIAHGDNVPATVIGNPKRPMQSQLVRGIMSSGADLVTAAQSGVISVYRFMAMAGLPEQELDSKFKKSIIDYSLRSLGRNQIYEHKVISSLANISPFEYYSLSIAIIFIFFNGLAGMHLLIEEKKSRMLTRIISCGVAPWKIVISKFCSLFIFQLFQLTILFAFIMLRYHHYFRGDAMAALLVVAATVAVVSSVIILIASCLREVYAADIFAFVLIMAMSFCGGGIIPLSYLPDVVERISNFSIHKWAMQGMIYSFFWDQWDKAAMGILVMSVMAIAALTAGVFALARTAR